MTLKEIKKEGYKRIIKGNEIHQDVYDDLKTNKPALNIKIADSLNSIPSKLIIDKFKTLRITYIILLSIIILLRSLVVYSLYVSHVIPWVLIIAFLFGIFLPILAIYFTVNHKYHKLNGISFLFIFSITRSLRKVEFNNETIFVFLIFIAVIVIGFLLSKYMKTTYKKITEYDNKTNKIKDIKIQFDNGNHFKNDDILDNL